MDYFNESIKNTYGTYIANNSKQETDFKSQFQLKKMTESNNKVETMFKYGDTTTLNVVEPENFEMFAHQARDGFNPVQMVPSGRRDNTLIINDYHTDITTQYAIKKKEVNHFGDLTQNPNVLTGSQPTYINDVERFNDSIRYDNNKYLPNTRLRPEAEDGTPITEDYRVTYKNLEERRGKGINSQRLAPEGKQNENGMSGEGIGLDPSKVKVETLTYGPRKQNMGDLLKTTGSITRHEWRSNYKDSTTNRDEETIQYNPAGAINSIGEKRNYQPTNATKFQEYNENIPVTNPKSHVQAMTHRNNQATNPTQFENYSDNIPVINPKTHVQAMSRRNHQPANPTQFEEMVGDVNKVINPTTVVNATVRRNFQPANPTQFEEMVGDVNQVINPTTVVNATVRRNFQPANPTQFEEMVGDVNKVINPTTNVVAPTYRNNQTTTPKQVDNYIETNYIGVGHNAESGIAYNNYQPANPTHIENYIETNYIVPGSNQTNTYKISKDLTREKYVDQYINTDYKGVGKTNTNAPLSQMHVKNIVIDDRKEKALDHTSWDMVGGTDQIAAGVENIGRYEVNGNRSKEGTLLKGGIYNGVPYNKVNKVRGKSAQNARQNIDNTIYTVLGSNPYVNNVTHRSIGKNDLITSRTNIFTKGVK